VFVRPVFSLIALAGTLLGASAAAGAQSAPYPLPSAPAAAAPQNQGPPPAGAHRKNRMRAALQQLDLSNDQRKQIASMMKSFRAARESATPITRKQLRSNIEGVLTPEQRNEFETLMHRPPQAVPPAAGGN